MSSYYHIRLQISKHSNYSNNSTTNTFLKFPSSLLNALPSHSAAPISKRRDTLRNTARRDYRFGPIRVDWVDFDLEGEEDMNVEGANGSQGQSAGDRKARSEERQNPVALFVPGSSSSSGTTNLPDGVVHIFRERVVYELDSQPVASTSANTLVTQEASTSTEAPLGYSTEKDYTTVAVLAVPPWMAPSDFLAFVAPAAEGMKHLRLIHDVSPNRTMVVIQFREALHASEFIEEFNGKQFNSVEPETCNIVRVRSVEIDTDDPVSLTVNRAPMSSSAIYELPTCPVCLDRMDASVTGLVTVPCSHTFHCMCLSKWGDSRCPVCRYSQIALSSGSQSSSSGFSYAPPPAGSRLASCTECDSRLNLWICLICGNVGCGRQGRAHAKGHYDLASHRYAMELATQRVWDYAGDNYVHRLIQNKADGKLVELPSAAGMDESQGRGRPGQGPGDDDNLKAEKMEILAMQYSQILQRAMEDQRAAYDEQTGELRRQLEDSQRKVEIMAQDTEQKVREARQEQDRRRVEDEERQAHLEREKIKAEKKTEKMTEVARRLERELKEERTVSQGLLENLSTLKVKVDVMDKEKSELRSKMTDLEEQMRDLMFFLEARDKIEQGGGIVSEAVGGSLELPQPSPNRTGTGGKKKKKK